MEKAVFMRFIDFKKDFEQVQQDEMIRILQQILIDDWGIRIIGNLYLHQCANIQVGQSVAYQ